MIRVFVVYEREPEPERYAHHVTIAERVPGATLRHRRATASAEFRESGRDART